MTKTPNKSHEFRVLKHGPSGRNDYEIAARLIDQGFARGQVRRDMQSSDSNILDVAWQGMTRHGERYAAYLQRELSTSPHVQWLAKAIVLMWPIAATVIGGLIVAWLT